MELAKTLESLVMSLAESQKTIVSQLKLDRPTNESVTLLEKAGNNLKEIVHAYETLSAGQDLLTAEMVLEMNFFPQGTMSVDKLYRLARENKIPAIRLDGRVFFSRRVLHEFVQERCRGNVASIEVKREQRQIQRKTTVKAPVMYESKITAIPE